MPKKFKTANAANLAPLTEFQVSLLDYIQDYAADVLAPLAIMQGASALRFWQEIFQPAQSGEAKRRINDSIRWPYAERLVYLAREFIKLDERRQAYIVKAAAAQIWWRGDDMQRFQSIVFAHIAYKNLSDSERAHYRRRLLFAAKTLAKSGANHNSQQLQHFSLSGKAGG